MLLQIARHPLYDCSILVVEDDYFLAEELTHELTSMGVHVVGPAPTTSHALALIAATPNLSAAVLDVNLRGGMSYPVADALLARRVPFIFATGYSTGVLTSRYPSAIRLEKPVKFHELEHALILVLHQASASS